MHPSVSVSFMRRHVRKPCLCRQVRTARSGFVVPTIEAFHLIGDSACQLALVLVTITSTTTTITITIAGCNLRLLTCAHCPTCRRRVLLGRVCVGGISISPGALGHCRCVRKPPTYTAVVQPQQQCVHDHITDTGRLPAQGTTLQSGPHYRSHCQLSLAIRTCSVAMMLP